MRLCPILSFAIAALVGCEGRLVGPTPAPSSDQTTPRVKWERPALPPVTDNGTDTGLRRLTRFEVERTVQQVFGVTGATSSLPRHAAFDGFFSNNMHGQRVSLGEVEELMAVAERIAVAAVPNLTMPPGCNRASLTAACQATLFNSLGKLAWRRPVTTTDLQRLTKSYTDSIASGLSAAESLEAVVASLVMSPAFLYRTETTFTPYELASRLSYAVWASAPDAELLDAARDGVLATAEGREAQLDRLLAGHTVPVVARAEAEAGVATIGYAENTWWNLWGEGTLTLRVTLAAPVETVVARVWQLHGGSEDARMELRVDGVKVTEAVVAALVDAPMSISVPLALGAGENTIEVEFLNNYIVGADDRNLYVDWVELRGHRTEQIAVSAVSQFVAEWLGASRVNLASKDQSWLVGTSPALQADLETEFERMVGAATLSADGRFDELLGGDFTWVNQNLARHYGLAPQAGADFVRVSLDGVERRGVLTQGLTMAAHTKESGEYSVVLLGKFVREHVLCQTIPPPPVTVDTNFPEGNYPAGWTHRQKFDQHTRANLSCAGCHAQLNPPGFAFYRLDPLGRTRLTDREGRAFDTSGTLENLDGKPAPFTALGDMVGQISKSQTARACFVRSFMSYALGRRASESDAALDTQLNESFEASEGNVRALLKAWVRSDAFVTAGPRKTETP